VLGAALLAAAEAELGSAGAIAFAARGGGGAAAAAGDPCAHPLAFSSGEWALPSAAEAAAEGAAPPCCAWDLGTANAATCAESVPAAPGALGALGARGGPRYFFSQSGGRACTCAASAARDAPRWRARGACGALPRFDARRFCALLEGRRLLFVGDSTSDQAATAVINTVRAAFGAPVAAQRGSAAAPPATVPPPPPSPSLGEGGGPPAVGCGERILFAPSDTLTMERFGKYNRGRHWLEYARALDPEKDVMVVSGGPHIYSSPALRRVVAQVAAEHAAHAPRLRLVWRSAWPGGCGDAPLAAPPDEDFWEAYTSSGRPIFTYADHREWDEVALPFFWGGGGANDSGAPRRAFLDVSPLLQRPDAHVGSAGGRKNADCLHLCQPGPLHPFLAQALLRTLEGLGLGPGEEA